jgi:hypothetical protein
MHLAVAAITTPMDTLQVRGILDGNRCFDGCRSAAFCFLGVLTLAFLLLCCAVVLLDAPAWDGNSEPRLLHKTVSTEQAPRVEAITSYAWADGKQKVSIYVDYPDAAAVDDELIDLVSDDGFSQRCQQKRTVAYSSRCGLMLWASRSSPRPP